MRKSDNGRVAWSSSLISKRLKKPKETDWFRRIMVGLQDDAKALSAEVKQRIHKAAIVVAKAIGGGWSNFRLAATAVKATVLSPQVVGERLIELFTFCYLKPGTDRPMIDHRGDVILAVEKLIGPMPAEYVVAVTGEDGTAETVTRSYVVDGDEVVSVKVDARNYVVTTHQRRYLASAAFLREHGISARQPMLISAEERQELRALMFAAKWGEAEGYFEKSWTVHEDGSLEVGLHPAGAVRGDFQNVVLYQHHVDKVDDVKRERWFAVLEQARTARKNDPYMFSQLEAPWHLGQSFRGTEGHAIGTWSLAGGWDFDQQRAMSVPGRGFVESWYESTFDMHDQQDRQDPTDSHPGYCGLVPLGSPTLVENQLQTRRVRARMGWEVRAYERRSDGSFVRISKNKEIVCNDGRIWTPEDADGNPEQDFFADPRQVLSWKDKETERWITIRRWNKMVMQKQMLEFKVPKGPNEQGFELYDHVRGRDITSEEAMGYLHDKSVIVSRDSSFRRELEGMFLSAVEEMAYTKIAFFEKDRGFGSPSFPIYRGATACKRCDSKWGSVTDAVKAQWTEMPHAYVCLSCGSEVWKVGARVFVDAKFFPFVIKRDKRVTHYAAEFFGPWVREMLDNTAKQRALEAHKASQVSAS